MTTTIRGVGVKPHRALNVTLWVAQSLLAAAFLMAGFMKLLTPYDDLAQKLEFVRDVPRWLPRFIGLCEVAGAVGLILPALTRIKPLLTAAAAASLASLMALACAFHLMRGEIDHLAPPIILGLLAAFVAWGRFSALPIAGRVIPLPGRATPR